MQRRRIAALVIGITAAVAGMSAAAPPAMADFYTHELNSDWSGLCLQPEGGSFGQGAAIVQEECNGTVIQQWQYVPVGNNLTHFVNAATGMCLDARGGAADMTPVQQWTCNSISNENWQDEPFGPDDGDVLRSRVSGSTSHCLDDPWGSRDAGTAVWIWRCNGTAAQLWGGP